MYLLGVPVCAFKQLICCSVCARIFLTSHKDILTIIRVAESVLLARLLKVLLCCCSWCVQLTHNIVCCSGLRATLCSHTDLSGLCLVLTTQSVWCELLMLCTWSIGAQYLYITEVLCFTVGAGFTQSDVNSRVVGPAWGAVHEQYHTSLIIHHVDVASQVLCTYVLPQRHVVATVSPCCSLCLNLHTAADKGLCFHLCAQLRWDVGIVF
jgi:hypothetical protein